MPNRSFSRATGLSVLVLAAACGGHSATPSDTTPKPREAPTPLFSAPLAGERIAVVPLTLVVAGEGVPITAPLDDRARTLAWADSLVELALESRAPEAKWIAPAELRKISRRSPGIAPDPDHMGQSLLRAEKLKEVPDPLRTHLRTLMALAGGRYAMVPAALLFVADGPGIRAELSLVLADTRNGRVIWRSLAWAVGASPEQALTAALASVLPIG